MKKIYMLIFCFVVINVNGQNRNGIITYKKIKLKKIFTEDKKERLGEKRFKKFSKIEKAMDESYQFLNFTLKVKNNESIFKVQNFLETPKHRFLKFAMGSEGKGVYYNSKKERIRQKNSFGEYFLILYPKPPLKWKLLNETKKIGNYLSYKATIVEKVKTGKGIKEYLIVAWYTPKINIQFGPIGFSGLPGLILELERNGVKYYVSNIELNPKKAIKINKPSKGKIIKRDDYSDLAIKSMKDYRKIRG